MRRKKPENIKRYLNVAEVLHCATSDEFNLILFGDTKRKGITDEYLPFLWKKGKLRRTRPKKREKFVYVLKRKSRKYGEMFTNLPHDLAASKCLARIWVSKKEVQFIEQKEFHGCGFIPDGAISFLNGKMILLEFCTEYDFTYTGEMRGKFSAYTKNLWKVNNKFKGSAIVLFVIDIDRSAVERYAGSVGSLRSPLYEGTDSPNPFFFCSYQDLISTEIGKTLQSPIYFWGGDGKERSLSA